MWMHVNVLLLTLAAVALAQNSVFTNQILPTSQTQVQPQQQQQQQQQSVVPQQQQQQPVVHQQPQQPQLQQQQPQLYQQPHVYQQQPPYPMYQQQPIQQQAAVSPLQMLFRPPTINNNNNAFQHQQPQQQQQQFEPENFPILTRIVSAFRQAFTGNRNPQVSVQPQQNQPYYQPQQQAYYAAANPGGMQPSNMVFEVVTPTTKRPGWFGQLFG